MLIATLRRRSILTSSWPVTLYSKRSFRTEPSNTLTTVDIRAPSIGKVRVLSLNRPAARNAISRQLLTELHAAISQVHDEHNQAQEILVKGRVNEEKSEPITRALVIASELDNCFCAGADLKERESFSAQETASFLSDLRMTFNKLADLAIPTISAISSVALGGGLELALCTHLRVISSNAELGFPETRLGIIPGAGGTYRLPAIIGPSRARDLVLTGRRVNGREAHLLGLADRLIEVSPVKGEGRVKFMSRAREEVKEAAITLAFEICEGAPIAINSALEATKLRNEEIEDQMYGRVMATEDRIEALNAFKERRKPEFEGR